LFHAKLAKEQSRKGRILLTYFVRVENFKPSPQPFEPFNFTQSVTENSCRHRFGNRRQSAEEIAQPFEPIELIEPFEPNLNYLTNFKNLVCFPPKKCPSFLKGILICILCLII